MPVSSLRTLMLTALTQALLFSACGTVQAAGGSLDETDQFALSQIASACGENATQSEDEFTTFFQGFLLSEAARRQHSTPEIHRTVYSSGTMLSDTVVSPEAYSGFPVQMIDYAYKPVEPAKAGDEDEYLDLQFNQSQTGDFSVEWARIHYDGQSDGGEDQGNPIDANGNPIPEGAHLDPEGQLLFQSTGGCWKFSADIRFKTNN